MRAVTGVPNGLRQHGVGQLDVLTEARGVSGGLGTTRLTPLMRSLLKRQDVAATRGVAARNVAPLAASLVDHVKHSR